MNSSDDKLDEPVIAHARRRVLPPLNMLRTFEAVARHRSVTRAAMELSVTQSAVSHQVKSLEQWLGQGLLQRNGRNVGLTPAGEYFYPRIALALDQVEQASAGIRQKPSKNAFRLSVFPTFATQWLMPLLGIFCDLYPKTEVQLITSGSSFDFDPRAYDLSIRCYSDAEVQLLHADNRWAEVEMHAFLAEHKTVVCSPSLRSSIKTLEDLSSQTLLESRSIPQAWTRWLEHSGLPASQWPTKRLKFDHVHLAVNAAQLGMGLALASPSFVRDSITNRSLLVPFPNLSTEPKNNYWIRPRGRNDNLGVNAFCEWLAKTAASQAEGYGANPRL